jgi:hypothetical protein
MAERGARLDRHSGHAVDVEAHRNDVIGARESPLGRLLIAEKGVDEDIVRHLVPNRRRAGTHGVLGVEHPRQHLVVDLHRFSRVERLRHGLRHHHGHGLADMAGLVGRQEQVRSDEHRAAACGMQLHIVSGLGQRIVRDRAQSVGETVGAREDAEHARHRLGTRAIDTENASVRMRRTHHHRVDLAREAEIVAEAAATRRQSRILGAHERLADGLKARRIRHDGDVGHRNG